MSEPVLSAEEWKAGAIERGTFDAWIDPGLTIVSDDGVEVANVFDTALPALIALANAALPDSDPGKITREWIRDMRKTADLLQGELRRVYGPESNWGNVPTTLTAMAQRVIDHADALARYLPPE